MYDISRLRGNGRGDDDDRTLSDQAVSRSRTEKQAVMLLNTAQSSVKISSNNMTCRRSQWRRYLRRGVCGHSLGWDCGFESRQGHGCLLWVLCVVR